MKLCRKTIVLCLIAACASFASLTGCETPSKVGEFEDKAAAATSTAMDATAQGAQKADDAISEGADKVMGGAQKVTDKIHFN